MKRRIYILAISVLLFSCQSEEIEGIWVNENKGLHSYTLVNISKDTLVLKHLSSFNYHLFNGEQVFIYEGGNTFSNDSFQIQAFFTDSLELSTFKSDSLIYVEKFSKLKQYKPELNIDDFKTKIQEKSIHYKMKQYGSSIDVIDSMRSYNLESNPIDFDYYDFFNFGDEIFFILDHDYPIPIQLVKLIESNNQIFATTELFDQEGELTITERSGISDSIKGKWKTQTMISDKIDSMEYITINRDSFIVDWINDRQNGFEILKLSKDSFYCLRADRIKPFLLKINQINKNELLVTNYRNRKESKIKLIKE